MSPVFDRNSAERFDWWRRTPEGQRALDLELGLIKRVLRPQVGDSVLDVGCGPAFHLRKFRDWNMRPVGIDASEAMVEFAQQRVGFHIPVFHGDAANLPFEDRSFDIVLFNTSLEFIDSPDSALREAVRVARKKLMIVILNACSLLSLSMRVTRIFKNDCYHQARLLNLWTLRKLIRNHVELGKLYWGSSVSLPLSHDPDPDLELSRVQQQNPFGTYIAICADLVIPVREKEAILNKALTPKVPSWAQRSYRCTYEDSSVVGEDRTK